MAFKVFGSGPIGVRLFQVTAAIDFDDQGCVGAIEVDEVGAYRALTAEFSTL